MKPPADRPPIIRFLLIFLAGLAIATGLAAVGHGTVEASAETAPHSAAQPGR